MSTGYESNIYVCQPYQDDVTPYLPAYDCHSPGYDSRWINQATEYFSEIVPDHDLNMEYACHSQPTDSSARENRRFKCPHCPRRFDKRADIFRHEASVHRDKLQCPPPLSYCTYEDCSRKDRGFTRSDNFREHMRRVHGETHPRV